MVINFDRIFKPTDEEIVEDLEMLLKIHRDQIGKCSTCEHYVSSSYSGDYGECKKNMDYFEEKVCGLQKIECSEYIENTSIYKIIYEKNRGKDKVYDCKRIDQ